MCPCEHCLTSRPHAVVHVHSTACMCACVCVCVCACIHTHLTATCSRVLLTFTVLRPPECAGSRPGGASSPSAPLAALTTCIYTCAQLFCPPHHCLPVCTYIITPGTQVHALAVCPSWCSEQAQTRDHGRCYTMGESQAPRHADDGSAMRGAPGPESHPALSVAERQPLQTQASTPRLSLHVSTPTHIPAYL